MRHKASTWGYTLTENADEGGYTIQLQGNLSIETAAESLERLLSELQKKTRPLYFDLSGVTTLDDYGALVLFEIKHHLQIPDAQFHIINPFDSYRKTLALVNFDFEQRCSVMPGSRRGNF